MIPIGTQPPIPVAELVARGEIARTTTTFAPAGVQAFGVTVIPLRFSGPLVTVDPKPIDFDFGQTSGNTRAIRATARQRGMPLLTAAKAAATQIAAQKLLNSLTPEDADSFLWQVAQQPKDERPGLPVVRVCGTNGATVIAIANPRDDAPAFTQPDASTQIAPREFFLIVVAPETKAAKRKKKA